MVVDVGIGYTYRRTCGLSWLTLSKNGRPLSAVVHSSNQLIELSQWPAVMTAPHIFLYYHYYHRRRQHHHHHHHHHHHQYYLLTFSFYCIVLFQFFRAAPRV